MCWLGKNFLTQPSRDGVPAWSLQADAFDEEANFMREWGSTGEKLYKYISGFVALSGVLRLNDKLALAKQRRWWILSLIILSVKKAPDSFAQLSSAHLHQYVCY